MILDRGHGTINGKEGQLIASVAGVVDKVNKLISVKPLKSRYQGSDIKSNQFITIIQLLPSNLHTSY